MSETSSSSQRPLRVVVRPGSKAELACRRYAARAQVAPKEPPPRAEVIAPGFRPRPELNLVDRRGKVITNLVYTNFYVGGADWDPQDRNNIDTKLAKAMSDRGLNNVLIQYFRGADEITSDFRPSSLLPGSAPSIISQPQVEEMVLRLHAEEKLNGFDFDNTVFNFMLAKGTVLTIDDGSDDRSRRPAHSRHKGDHTGHIANHKGETEEAASSLEGLGGFHGAVKAGSRKIYYAVGVFSEGRNGIVAFDQPWKNVVATFYHELVEARTDADVEDGRVAWVNDENPSEEIGDIPLSLAGANLQKVMKEVPLTDGSGNVPIQLMWSNAVNGPEGPITAPHPAEV